jgi:hypothetical protein
MGLTVPKYSGFRRRPPVGGYRLSTSGLSTLTGLPAA